MRLRLIAKRSPSVPQLQSHSLLPSNKFSSLFWLRQMVSWAAPNGGEGGIRTPGTLSGTTDFESVTFGHSATSPKSWVRKSSRRALASTDYRSCSRYAPQNGHCFLSYPEGIRLRNPCGVHNLRAIALRLPLLLKVDVELAKLIVRRYT